MAEEEKKEEEKKKIGQGRGRNARKRKKEEEKRKCKDQEEGLKEHKKGLENDKDKLEVHMKGFEEEVEGLDWLQGQGLKQPDSGDNKKRIKEPKNLSLVEFMERQILDLEEELECPVCLEVATAAPIYKCPDDHLLCRCSAPAPGAPYVHLIRILQCFVAGFAGLNYPSAPSAGSPLASRLKG